MLLLECCCLLFHLGSMQAVRLHLYGTKMSLRSSFLFSKDPRGILRLSCGLLSGPVLCGGSEMLSLIGMHKNLGATHACFCLYLRDGRRGTL